MNFDEKELQKLLNREKIKDVSIDRHEITITTEDKVITIASIDRLHLQIDDREFIE